MTRRFRRMLTFGNGPAPLHRCRRRPAPGPGRARGAVSGGCPNSPSTLPGAGWPPGPFVRRYESLPMTAGKVHPPGGLTGNAPPEGPVASSRMELGSRGPGCKTEVRCSAAGECSARDVEEQVCLVTVVGGSHGGNYFDGGSDHRQFSHPVSRNEEWVAGGIVVGLTLVVIGFRRYCAARSATWGAGESVLYTRVPPHPCATR